MRRFAVAGAVVAVLLLANSAVAAASGWSIEHTPNPTGASSSYLYGVSCVSASACTAVGYHSNGTTDVALAERWNGTKWSIEHTPTPAGASGGSYLFGVSCVSASACTAVGQDYNATTGFTLAERWNGSKWSIEHAPSPTGATSSELDGVSCASASACTAVGQSNPTNATGVMLAERWNGTKWSIEPTPSPTGVSYSELNGVSCTSGSACTAVGLYKADTLVPLAERWNGTKWSIQPTPNPTGASDSYLEGVSCVSASACTASGYYDNANNTLVAPLAERWSGTKWSIQPTPNPAGASQSTLYGVSCTSASACTAVGYYASGSTYVTLAERWNGTKWSIQHTPNPTGAPGSWLDGVSCASASTCTAVGDPNFSPPQVTLAERWNGSA